ncbi:hypothetical protein D3C78_1855910 [compost metagenome]
MVTHDVGWVCNVNNADEFLNTINDIIENKLYDKITSTSCRLKYSINYSETIMNDAYSKKIRESLYLN